MRNEDTGEPIQCPHCGSKDDCPHLLAVIDSSFLECSGGYAYDRFNEFRAKIEESFLKYLQTGKASGRKWNNPELRELWTYADSQYPETGEVDIDGDVLFRLIVDLLEEAGGEEYYGPIDDEGGPRFSSAITLFYSKNPQDVFERAISDLDDYLGK